MQSNCESKNYETSLFKFKTWMIWKYLLGIYGQNCRLNTIHIKENTCPQYATEDSSCNQSKWLLNTVLAAVLFFLKFSLKFSLKPQIYLSDTRSLLFKVVSNFLDVSVIEN